MKTHLFIFLITVLAGSNAMSAEVTSARVDTDRKNLVLDVTYIGGCGRHKFSLEMTDCTDSVPTECKANLVEESKDKCESGIRGTVVLPLAEHGLTAEKYRGATLTIFGDDSSSTNEPTSASVRLPDVYYSAN